MLIRPPLLPCLLAALLAARGADEPAPARSAPDAAALITPYRPDAGTAARTEEALRILAEDGPAERRAAMTALRDGPLPDRAALIRATRADDPELADSAEEIRLAREERTSRDFSRIAEALETKPQPLSLDGLLAMRPWLDAEETRVRWTRAFSLAAASGDEALLLRLTGAADADLRVAGLRALRKLKSPNLREPAARLAADPEPAVQLEAAQALASVGDERCLPVIAGLIAGPRGAARDAAADLLVAVTGLGIRLNPTPEQDGPAWLAWIQANRPAGPLRPLEARPAFDADNLSNWTCVAMGQAADPLAFWTSRGGVLSFRGGTSGVLRTKPAFTDVTVSFEWRWKNPAGGDGGLWMFLGDGNEVMPNGLEIQLLHGAEGDFWRLGNFAGRLGDQGDARHVPRAPKAPMKPAGEWNHARVEVISGRLTVEINGVKCNTAQDLPAGGGRIGLQMENSAYEVRDLRVQPVE